ncbi:MAG: outer membrane beta-barrel protein [Flavobacteriaceae bacterium]|nr:outer membrane beta-barrel protein [Flavobacteriaceae bacterium]
MSLRNLLFVTIACLSLQQINAQRNFDEYNRMGIFGGLTLFDINTSDFVTEQGSGFAGGFTTRGSFRNNFDLIYGISFYSTSLGIEGSDLLGSDTQSIEYNINAAQITFLSSYNIIKHHLSVEFGPILQINSEMKLNSERLSNYFLTGYNSLQAEDVQDISKVNFHVAGGITAGMEDFRVFAQYQYGVTNTFNKLNDKNLEKDDFEGHSSTFTFGALFYF